MQFLDFLSQAKQKAFWQQHSVIFFQGESYSCIWFKCLFAYLLEKNLVAVRSLQPDEKNSLIGELNQCFLGQSHTYWLGELTAGSGKKKKNDFDLIAWLSEYCGPHIVICFVDPEKKLIASKNLKTTCVVELPPVVSHRDAQMIFDFFDYVFTEQRTQVIRSIFDAIRTLPLDMVMMINEYVSVTPVRLLENVQQHITTLVQPEISLYALSQSFFTKKEKEFFKLWSACHADYTQPFWIAFWAEQIWRAYHVTLYSKQNDFVAARRYSFRLYPAFLRQDWQLCNRNELIGAYHMIYDIDFAFKKGSEFCSFDLFFNSYFLGKFAQ